MLCKGKKTHSLDQWFYEWGAHELPRSCWHNEYLTENICILFYEASCLAFLYLINYKYFGQSLHQTHHRAKEHVVEMVFLLLLSLICCILLRGTHLRLNIYNFVLKIPKEFNFRFTSLSGIFQLYPNRKLDPTFSLPKLNNITPTECVYIKFHEDQETEQKCMCPSIPFADTLIRIWLACCESQGWNLGLCMATSGSEPYYETSSDHETCFLNKHLLHKYYL